MEKGQLIHVLAFGDDIELFIKEKYQHFSNSIETYLNRSMFTGDALPKAKFIPNNFFLSFRSIHSGPFLVNGIIILLGTRLSPTHIIFNSLLSMNGTCSTWKNTQIWKLTK